MKKLPALRAKEVVQILKKFGFQEDRQKGSHSKIFSDFISFKIVPWSLLPEYCDRPQDFTV